MIKTKLNLKKAISPVIASILLLVITVIIGVLVFQFLTQYSENQFNQTQNNQFLDDFNIRVVDTNSQQSIIQTPFEEINITRVLLDGVECLENSGVISGRPLRINLSSCSSNTTNSRPRLTIETEEGIIQRDLNNRELQVTPRVSEVAQIPTDLNCFEPSNINVIGEWEGCEGMLIVNRSMLLDAIEINGGIDRQIEAYGQNFTFGNSQNNIFTGQVTDMSFLFENSNFNSSIGYWDTRNVTNMRAMFKNAPEFDQNIGGWNVGRVTSFGSNSLTGMFQGATSFNNGGSPEINNWNTSSATIMRSMFRNAQVFNQPIGDWDVSLVENMRFMFNRAFEFNQPIGNWNTSNVIIMDLMFVEAFSFDQDIGNWNISSVTRMHAMFYRAPSFNNGGSDSINNWNVSNVRDFSRMFEGNSTLPSSFNQPIGNWDITTSATVNMRGMFKLNPVFNQDISNWDVSLVTNMIGLFDNSTSFNQDLSSWCVSHISSPPSEFDLNSGFEGQTHLQPQWGESCD